MTFFLSIWKKKKKNPSDLFCLRSSRAKYNASTIIYLLFFFYTFTYIIFFKVLICLSNQHHPLPQPPAHTHNHQRCTTISASQEGRQTQK